MIIFILPGFWAYLISNSLYRKPRNESELKIKEIEVTYRSLLYSCGMYLILYALLRNSLIDLASKYPLWTCLMMTLFSTLWGIMSFEVRTHDLLYLILSKLHLTGKVTPPNLYAAVLDPTYSKEANTGRWVSFEMNQENFEGYVELADVAETERLVLLKEIRRFDEYGDLLEEYPNDLGMIIDLTKVQNLIIS